MTVPKALKLINWWIAQRENILKEVLNFNDSEITTIIHNSEKTIISNLKLIRGELVPKCKHPKKMQDTCNGQKYCMACNWDL